jgi:hypothetical protein
MICIMAIPDTVTSVLGQTKVYYCGTPFYLWASPRFHIVGLSGPFLHRKLWEFLKTELSPQSSYTWDPTLVNMLEALTEQGEIFASRIPRLEEILTRVRPSWDPDYSLIQTHY